MGGINAGVVSVWMDDFSLAEGAVEPPSSIALRTIGLMHSELAESESIILQAKTAEEIIEAKRRGRIALVYCFEGTAAFDTNVSYVYPFHQLGVRLVTLTWNRRNLVANGCMERSDCGLSEFGIELAEELNKNHILIDLSHISSAGFYEVLQLSKDPPICSHSNSKHVCDHPRNLSDEQIHALAEKGGVVGVCFYPTLVKPKDPRLTDILDHIDHIADLVGIDHIGIGGDFSDYVDWAEFLQVTMSVGTLKRDAEVASSSEPTFPEGLETASEMFNITRGLISRGYSDQEIEKILGLNFTTVFERVWRA